ncbi:MAG: hypothetical protein KAT69_07860 [Candidatus Aminicenantes bacterium]|nr:hypothetical protein [Candidatus Aminicenantes bacterium]
MKCEYAVIAHTQRSGTDDREHTLACEKTITVEQIHDWLNSLTEAHGKTTKVSVAKIISQSTKTDLPKTTAEEDNWSANLVDIRVLCHAVAKGDLSPEYVTANMPALNKWAKTAKDDMNVPGVEAVNNPVLSSR